MKNSKLPGLTVGAVLVALLCGCSAAPPAQTLAPERPTPLTTSQAPATPTAPAAPAVPAIPATTATPEPAALQCTAGERVERLIINQIGLDAAGVEPYTSDQLHPEEGVVPADQWTVVQFIGQDGRDANGNLIATKALYGHSSANEAVFNGIKSLQVNTEATVITTEGTVEQYRMTGLYTVEKARLDTHPEYIKNDSCRMVVVACFRPDGYNPALATRENVFATFERFA